MTTFSAVQQNATLWCVQRSDGNYLQDDSGGNRCWSTSNTMKSFGQDRANSLAWCLNNPPTGASSYQKVYDAASGKYGIQCVLTGGAYKTLTEATGGGSYYWYPGSPTPNCGYDPELMISGFADSYVWACTNPNAPGV